MVAIIAMGVAIVAVLLAFYQQRRLRVLSDDLRYVHRSLRVALDRAEEETKGLRTELEALHANPPAPDPGEPSWFSPMMTIQDALALHPGVKGVLATFHIGGCSSCSVSAKETLEQASKGHGVDLKAMLKAMNKLMETSPGESELFRAEQAMPPPEGGRLMLAVQRAE